MSHGRGKNPPTRKGPRVPNNKGSVAFGYEHSDATPREQRSPASSNNVPRARRKISRGFGSESTADSNARLYEVTR